MTRIFVSHSSMDKVIIHKIVSDLAALGYPVWLDTWNLEVGDTLTSTILQAITDSDIVIIALSADSVASPWCQKELEKSLDEEIKRKRKAIFPLKVGECVVPVGLQDRICSDFTNSYTNAMRSLLKTLDRAYPSLKGQEPRIPLRFEKGTILDTNLAAKAIKAARAASKQPSGFVVYDPTFEWLFCTLGEMVDGIQHVSDSLPYDSNDVGRFYNRAEVVEDAMLIGVRYIIESFFEANAECVCITLKEFCRLSRSAVLGYVGRVISHDWTTTQFIGTLDEYSRVRSYFCDIECHHLEVFDSGDRSVHSKVFVPITDLPSFDLPVGQTSPVRNELSTWIIFRHVIPQLLFAQLWEERSPQIGIERLWVGWA